MTTRNNSLRTASWCAALVLTVLVARVAKAEDIVIAADCLPRLTAQQQRLYDHANAGTDSLRQFIFIRRAILQVDVYETAVWAASVDAARVSCVQRRTAAASPM
jgi:hypothetical protein